MYRDTHTGPIIYCQSQFINVFEQYYLLSVTLSGHLVIPTIWLWIIGGFLGMNSPRWDMSDFCIGNL